MNKADLYLEYLGDGVYARFDGYQVWLSLDAERDDEGRCSEIALEPKVLVALNRYYEAAVNQAHLDNNAMRESAD